MIIWKDRHKHCVPVSSKAEIDGLEMKLKKPDGYNQWYLFVKLPAKNELPGINFCDGLLLASSLLGDAKEEAVSLVLGKIIRVCRKLQDIKERIEA